MKNFKLGNRLVGGDERPLVIAELGINHEGDINKALQMVDDAARAGCECVKIQTHILEDEMIPNDVIPANANESIWEIMNRCKLSEAEEYAIKEAVEERGMIYLSTPFSKAAADRIYSMGVTAFKIGSGECNNYPLIEHIANYGLPIILSTGMNNLHGISKAVQIIRSKNIPYALLHCVSVYPTPYHLVQLGVLEELTSCFPDAVIGLSDHSPSIYPCLGAVALGASVLEKHFTSDKSWPGPDIEVSINPDELRELIEGSRIIFQSRGGSKKILAEEQGTKAFADACVVSITDIAEGDYFTKENTWVKRPGNGEIKAEFFESVLGSKANCFIAKDNQIKWEYLR